MKNKMKIKIKMKMKMKKKSQEKNEAYTRFCDYHFPRCFFLHNFPHYWWLTDWTEHDSDGGSIEVYRSDIFSCLLKWNKME